MQRYKKGAPDWGTPYKNLIIIFIFISFSFDFSLYEDNDGTLILWIIRESPVQSKRRPRHRRGHDGDYRVDNRRVLKSCEAGDSLPVEKPCGMPHMYTGIRNQDNPSDNNSSKALLWATRGRPSINGSICFHTTGNTGASSVS